MCKYIDIFSRTYVKYMYTMSRKVNIQVYATYFGVSRQTIHGWLRRYNAANKVKYDQKDIQLVFEFFEYLQKQFFPASIHAESHK